MLAILLAVATALSYGLANFLAPVFARRMPLAAVLGGSQLSGLAASVAFAAARDRTMSTTGLASAMIAGVTNALALACFYRAGQTGDLSIISPIAATGAIVPVLVGLMSAERPSTIQLIAIPAALIGIALAARRPVARASTAQPPHIVEAPPSPPPGIGWAMLAALLFGIFLTAYAWAADDSLPGALLWSRLALVTTTGAGILILRAPARVPARLGTLALVPGLLLVLGTLAYGEATRIGLLSVVSVIATLNPVVTCLLAFVLLGERPAAAQRLGALLALAGAALLTLA